MNCSRMGWTAGVITPWCLGMVLAVSMSADAGQEIPSGMSLSPLPLRAPAQPAMLIPASPPAQPSGLAIDFGELTGEAGKILREASLSIGGGEDFRRLPDEIAPRADLKRNAREFPSVDRSHKGDPFVGLRPEFDSRLRQSDGLANLRAGDLLFRHDEDLPAAGFPVARDEAAANSATDFVPWLDGDSPATAHSSAGASPGQYGSVVTMRPRALNARLMQGATPPVRRAIALESITPVPADSTPVEVVALPGEPRKEAPAAPKPNYAALPGQDKAARENLCLAKAIYFEARSESEEGQAAVAQVVLNRVASGLYPPTICGVVYQNRRRRNGCQFSFACEGGGSPRMSEPDAWRKALQIAAEVTNGKTYVSDIAGSTHYHANYSRPRWARRLEKMDVIGHHIFYKLRPGRS